MPELNWNRDHKEPIGHCGTCKHLAAGNNSGRCSQLGILVPNDFGCLKFEKQPDPPPLVLSLTQEATRIDYRFEQNLYRRLEEGGRIDWLAFNSRHKSFLSIDRLDLPFNFSEQLECSHQAFIKKAKP